MYTILLANVTRSNLKDSRQYERKKTIETIRKLYGETVFYLMELLLLYYTVDGCNFLHVYIFFLTSRKPLNGNIFLYTYLYNIRFILN